jgi:hypothetical protein
MMSTDYFLAQRKGIIMKKLILTIAGAAVVLAGCSGLSNIDLPQLGATPTLPPPVDSPTPAATDTPIPTQDLFATSTSTPLTFTPTVTLMGAELFTPTGTATSFSTQIVPTLAFPTPGLPPEASSAGYFTPQSVGFLTILVSSNIMYWNEGPCSPRNVEISAFVEDIVNTHRVFLFTRLREKKNTLNVTRWNAGAVMVKEENGSYNYNIRTFNLRRYYYYREAWLEYQLVALTEDQQEIGRTPIYDRNITLAMCRPVQ